MLGYVTVGTNDIPRALAFYDALLAEFGAKRLIEHDGFIAWGADVQTPPMFAIARPFDGKPATVGNGSMVALLASSKAQVDAIHRKALALGGSDEGPPGPRSDTFYAAYFRDLDGNKLNVFFMG